MRLIDSSEATAIIADYFDAICDTEYTFDEAVLLKLLNDKAVDAVPIIRCKDCRHWGQDGYREGCKYAVTIMTEDDYCSMAERREHD